MPIRPEAEQKLRAGFQRRVDRQAERYVEQLTHAERLAVRLECGEVAGVFSGRAGGEVRRGAYAVGVLPLAAIPVLVAGGAAGVPGAVPLLGTTPFIAGAWFGLTMWRRREPRRRVWLYAFAQGCALMDGLWADAVVLRWSEITEVGENVRDVSAEESRPTLTAYRRQCADGRACEISRSRQNVHDPYPNVGSPLRGLTPPGIGTAMPKFPTIDEVIAAFAGKPGPRMITAWGRRWPRRAGPGKRSSGDDAIITQRRDPPNAQPKLGRKHRGRVLAQPGGRRPAEGTALIRTRMSAAR